MLIIEWTQIHAIFHSKLNMMLQDKAIYLILTIICCSNNAKAKLSESWREAKVKLFIKV